MKMQHATLPAIAASVWLGVMEAAGIASAQQQPENKTAIEAELGKREFDSNCAACHGSEGRGDGPHARAIKKTIPDLTTLSERNSGSFPWERVYHIIDGTEVPPGHATREMPMWGDVYQFRPEKNSYIIMSLTQYIYRMQTK